MAVPAADAAPSPLPAPAVRPAHNIALASLKGFTLPGDISASSRYFDRDVISPEVTVDRDGTVAVPDGVGLGFEVDVDFINHLTETRVYIS